MERKLNIDKIMVGAAFAFYVIITCYKLTNAPLWFDETVEFWYSKIMFGKLPFEGAFLNESTNMYERIVSTFQPPLFNVIMYFWLKLGTSEWWFRFFGVVMGAIGNIGIYKAVKKISNVFVAAGTVFFSSCVFQLVYFWQECAEYSLMLGLLCWTVYAFICLLEEQNKKNIIVFTILSILPVYSQYGAAFPVAAMLIIAYVFILQKKDKKNTITITVSYVAALLFAALPLFFFFVIKQMKNQQGGEIQAAGLSVEGNIFVDMYKGFREVVSWNLFSYYDGKVATFFSWIFIIGIVLLLIFSKKTYIRLLAVTNIITWLLYYFAVKLGMYSYGEFGSRYNLFFIPLWIISIFGFGYEIYYLLRTVMNERFKDLSNIYIGICISLIVCFMVSGWTLKIQYNWTKEDMRTAVDTWMRIGAQDSETIVYYAGDSGFLYYLRGRDDYSPEIENNVAYMPWMREKTVEEYTDYINSLYGNDWPFEIYIIATHTKGDINTFVSAFTDKGYITEDYSGLDYSLMRLVFTEGE